MVASENRLSNIAKILLVFAPFMFIHLNLQGCSHASEAKPAAKPTDAPEEPTDAATDAPKDADEDEEVESTAAISKDVSTANPWVILGAFAMGILPGALLTKHYLSRNRDADADYLVLA